MESDQGLGLVCCVGVLADGVGHQNVGLYHVGNGFAEEVGQVDQVGIYLSVLYSTSRFGGYRISECKTQALVKGCTKTHIN